ncbi:rRNA biogenesis protein rrp5 [Erysiphe neolycopersici]|uniref:rRNA biogenesis protein RRP5 n=1 Tax=Erysiphe neolycopersici TaxID=212602 RepID=A0A420HN46_9PEZI|nr:rRNA biogenesis protein rrp5 [Erysiphe neolycopersici]
MAPEIQNASKRKREEQDEAAFPRGGGSILTPLEHKQIQIQATRDVLFEHNNNESSEKVERPGLKVIKRRKIATKVNNKGKKKVIIEADQDCPKIESLNFKRLGTGSLVLGQISEIHESEIVLTLPNNLTGYVPITSISDKLTNRLECISAIADDEDQESSTEEIELHKIFKIGQYLRAYVVSTSNDSNANTKTKKSIQISLRPQDTNNSINPESIVVNSTLMTSIISVEDHGVILDLGFEDSSIRGFISSKEIGDDFELQEMQEGALLFCIVTGISSNGKVIKLSANKNRIGKFDKHFLSEAPSVDIFLPGTVVEALVTDISARGLVGKIMGMVDVTADLIHSGSVFSEKELQKIYKIGSKLKARVICTFPQTEPLKLGVSTLDHILSLRLKQASKNGDLENPLALLPMSSIVEKVIVKKLVSNIGLFVDVNIKGIPGFVHISRISDKKIEGLSESSGPYALGSVHRGRVTGFNSIDGMYNLSFQQSVIEKPFLCIEDVEVGSIVQGKVEKLLINPSGVSGIIVNLTEGISGLVPQIHISDVKLLHPEQKFKEGANVTARVLSTDATKRQIRLTLKKSLVNSDAKQFLDYRTIEPRMNSPGTIINIIPSGAVVQFYGNVRGFLPVAEMSEAYIKDPSHHFHIGQVVNVYVLNVDPNLERMTVSCKNPSSLSAAQQLALQKLDIGHIVSAKVVAKFEEEIQLIIEGIELRALLPVANLSNGSASKNRSLLKNIKVGGIMTDLTVIKKVEKQRIIILTKKPSLFKENKVITKNERTGQAQPSMKDLKNESNQILTDGALINPIDENIKLLSDIVVGIRTKARITSVKDTQLNVQLADNVKGRIDFSQIFDSWDSIKDHKRPLKSFSSRQIIDVRVLGTHNARKHCFLPITHRSGKISVFELSAKPSDLEGPLKDAITLDKIELKSSWIAFVNNVTEDCLWVNLTPNIRGRIAALEASDDVSRLEDLESKFPIGSALKAHVINIDIENNHLDLSARPKNSEPLTFKNLIKCMVVPGKVVKIDKSYILVQLSDSLVGQVNLVDLADDFTEANPTKYSKGEIIRVCVCDIDISNKKIRLSTRPSRVLNSCLAVQDPDITSVKQLKINDVVRGFVKNISDKGVFVSLSWKITAYARVSDLSDSFIQDWKSHIEIDSLVRGKVISVDETQNKVQISLKASILEKDYSPPISFESLKVGQFVTGKVRKVEEYGIFIVIDGSDNVSGLCHKSELADQQVQDVKKLYEVGDTVKASILKLDRQKRRVNFGLKTSYFEEIGSESDSELDERNSVMSVISQKNTMEGDDSSDTEGGGVYLNEVEDTLNSVNRSPNLSAEDSKYNNPNDNISVLNVGGFNWSGNLDLSDIESDSSGISDGSRVPKKKKKLKKARIAIDRTGDLDANEPSSVSDFERLLLGQPESSKIWIQYMAFQIQLGNLSEARATAERAIKTINPKEETEKLNIWVALLNLENIYGSEEATDEVFTRACQFNDPQEIYERFISILIQSGKHSKADSYFQTLVKKFSQSPAVWYNYAHFLHTVMISPDHARALLSRATQSLPPHTHLNLTLKFAALEFHSKSGSPERGRTIIEGLLSTFPKRLDIWNQLLDLEIQQGDKEIVRGVFKRVIKLKALKPKRAKHWFKKWSEWEEKNGDKKDCERVKALAEEWVRSVSELTSSKHAGAT